ncbi:F-box protein At3g54460 [Seminavis robusta]|uniref:F-box protein At3g54460 n=1 Tax=Seminavis robusta TaxID=568900 RepID=A0A9N8DNE6_9STRA|nr:F-box protein At3g54460 [Seminavis robusta]|eukprot:Sro179_g078480.1 F-box protein At3g54460 (1503) ;mRNA; f:37933-42855
MPPTTRRRRSSESDSTNTSKKRRTEESKEEDCPMNNNKTEEPPPERNSGENVHSLSTTEMGYVLLSDCSIAIISSSDESTTSALSNQSTTCTWMDVSPTCLPKENMEDTGTSIDINNSDDVPCPRCNLIFHDSNDGQLSLCTSNVARFQATLADMVVHPKERGKSCTKQRSDAALLCGAILAAQDHGYVAIQQIKVLVHGKQRQKDDNNHKASLLVTFAFPSLTVEEDSEPVAKGNTRKSSRQQPSIRSIVPPSPQGTTRTSNLKPLPTSVQFLLSIIRSDWDCLGTRMKQLENGWREESRSRPFFPPALSMEELYTRIRGSNDRVQMDNGDEPSFISQQSTTLAGQNAKLLTMIPMDILKTQIASFLRAKSLNSLRCTCKSLHQSLQAVVPGFKLRLFRHQIKSLQWMRHREVRPISETTGQENLDAGIITLGEEDDNDPIRAMTGGQSVWLCPRPKGTTDHDSRKQGGIRIDQMTGHEQSQPDALARQGARGGLLSDDPGLGKTITLLALFLQTLGLETECATKQEHGRGDDESTKKPVVSDQDEMFGAYWKEDITPEFRRPALYRLLARFKKVDPVSAWFFQHPIDPENDECEDYADVIKEPICFADITKRIASGDYGADFDAFVLDVELCFKNAMEYNPKDHEVHEAAQKFLDLFRHQLIVEFKKEQLGSLRSSASNAGLKPNSSVAALLQKKAGLEFEKKLLPSSTTLLVIPPGLMEHWQEQIRMHVDPNYATKLIPLTYEYTPNRKSALGLEEALRLTQIDKTHYPFIFVDKAGTQKLPSPEFLAMFKIVITTTRRFTNEWKNGSFQEELAQKRSQQDGHDRDGRYVKNYRLMEYGSADEEACPLLKINWLRMVVDEGHAMGRGKGNSAISFASWISAQRRWAMTGTPTQQTISKNGLNNLNGLMTFLQHDFFTRRKEGDKVWKRLIAKSFKDGHLAAFYRLKSLLTLLMIRHTKLDIEELPQPVYTTTVVPMSLEELTTYNTLVSAVQINLQVTAMEGKSSGKQDSLLHRSQAKHAQRALENIRRVCCGESRVYPTITDEHWVEFIHLCRDEHKMSPETIQKMDEYVQRATSEQLSRCYCCGILLSMQLVMPCGCLLCTECNDSSRHACAMCDKPYDVDEFQILQPGFMFEWKRSEDYAYVGDKASGQTSETATARVVQDGPAAAQGPAVQGAPAVNQLLLRPPAERRRTRKPGDGHVCEYSRSFEPGKCLLCFEEHSHCKLVNKSSCCQTCFREPKECPTTESKSFYLINKLLKLYEDDQKRDQDFRPSASHVVNRRRFKVIVFSQFRRVLNLVGNHLLKRFGTACIGEYWGSTKSQELHKFVHSSDCFVLLLSKDGSEGLDLSFVTHIFFLEAVWDKSLEQQAVARAWRMGRGSIGPVEVETLLAKTSVEEKMKKMEEARAAANLGVASGTGAQRGKIQLLLKSLNLLPDIANVPLPHPDDVKAKQRSDLAVANVSTESTTATSASLQEDENLEERQPKRLKRPAKKVAFNMG